MAKNILYSIKLNLWKVDRMSGHSILLIIPDVLLTYIQTVSFPYLPPPQLKFPTPKGTSRPTLLPVFLSCH